MVEVMEVEAEALTAMDLISRLAARILLRRPAAAPKVLVVHDEPRCPRALAMFADVACVCALETSLEGGRRRRCRHRAIISALASGGLQRGLHGS